MYQLHVYVVHSINNIQYAFTKSTRRLRRWTFLFPCIIHLSQRSDLLHTSPHDPVLAFLVVAITWGSILNIAITLSIKRPPRAHLAPFERRTFLRFPFSFSGLLELWPFMIEPLLTHIQSGAPLYGAWTMQLHTHEYIENVY